jgi:hypothetical protein
VPVGCAVKGIEVRVDWWLSQSTFDTGMSSVRIELSWNGGTSWTAFKADTVETTSEHSTVLGGANDFWGRASWTATEVNNTNFRVRITSFCDGQLIGDIDCSGDVWFLDWIPVRVYFGLP